MINVIAEFKPINNGRFALMDDSVIRGGFHVVPTLFERDRIPADRRKIGMLVNVIENGTIYKLLDNGTWLSSFNPYSFSTGFTVSENHTVSINFGTTSGSVCSGDDSRLSNARTPLQHNLLSHVIENGVNGQILVVTSGATFSFVTMAGDATIDKDGVIYVRNIKGTQVEKLGIFIIDIDLDDDVDVPRLIPEASFETGGFLGAKIDFVMFREGRGYSCGYIKLMYDGTNVMLSYVEDNQTGDLGIEFSANVVDDVVHLYYTSVSSGYATRFKFTTIAF